MEKKDYVRHVTNAPELEERLFHPRNGRYKRLLKELKQLEEITCEEMVGVPLVQPYGGPVVKYIALPKRIYWEMRRDLRENKYKAYPEIGVFYPGENSAKDMPMHKPQKIKNAPFILEIIEKSRKSVDERKSA